MPPASRFTCSSRAQCSGSEQVVTKPDVHRAVTTFTVEKRRVLLWSAALAILTLLSIFLIDRPLSRAIAPHEPAMEAATGPVISALELIFGFEISKFLTGAVILVASLVLFAFARYRPIARILLFVAAAQLTTRLVAGVLKNVFLRSRPFETYTGFFSDGSSFPSGHAAHFWPFFFAAIIAFPRGRIPLLILALFVSASRVLVNDHFLGDVLASGAIAAIITYGYARTPILKRAE